ncbi:MAG: hypothetical protein J6I96_06590 [Oscillospiraceae bacterium]|nr:hypothetical protein [Oscillospiraceae bacterium]
MDKLQMAEILVNKCGITYEEAAAVLEQSGYDMLEAMVILERNGRIRGGGYSGRRQYVVSKRRASDANSLGEFIRMFWKNFVSGAEHLIKSRLVITMKNDTVRFPLIVALLMVLVINIPMAIAVVISMICGCRYSIEIR